VIDEKSIKEKRNGHQTQWASQFAVASELCKRNYEVSFTMGNSTPLADLMVVSPKLKKMFLVDVKGLYRRNPWVLKRKFPRDNLFYVFAYVPTGQSNEFFVMTQKQANSLVQQELTRLKRPNDYPMTGITWPLVLPCRDAWDVLPK
jgi:hypothetical protein